jgi:phosphoglucosamine mutase
MRKLFGTDGIRGIANQYPMTPELMIKLGKAAVQVIKKDNKKIKILIGKDTRISGYLLESALTSGIVSMGADVLLVGPMPTPAIAHLTKSFAADAGITISASHNPAEDNGIKFFSNHGYKLLDNVEEEIEKLIFSNRFENGDIKGNLIGKAKRIDDAKGRYIEFAKSSINNNNLKTLKIVLDCANGATYHIAPDIFRELGADVVVVNDKPNGLNINKECGALYPEKIKDLIILEKADIGVTFDGDGDRVILLDEKGNIIDGDYIMAICGIDMLKKGILKQNTITATHYSNIGLEIALKKYYGKLVRVECGDRYVIDEMKKKGYNLGGEQAGHIIFSDYNTTGDGIITALKILDIMKNENKKLSQLASVLEKYPQVIVNVKVREKKDLDSMPNVMKQIKEVEKELSKHGRVYVRYSGTENKARVMVEGKSEEEVNKYANKIAEAIRKEIGE